MNEHHHSLPDNAINSGGGFEIGSFDFHGKPVIILSNESGNWAVLGQLCGNLTLDANGQRQMIERKAWSKGRTCNTHVQLPGDAQARQHFLVHERIVPMWLQIVRLVKRFAWSYKSLRTRVTADDDPKGLSLC